MNHDLQIKFRQAFDSPIPSNELKSKTRIGMSSLLGMKPKNTMKKATM